MENTLLMVLWFVLMLVFGVLAWQLSALFNISMESACILVVGSAIFHQMLRLK